MLRARDGPALWRSLAASDTGRAAGMAAAVIAANVIALVFTVVFARMLGATGYGSLAALMSAFIILMVPGSALQIAVAREVCRARRGRPRAGGGLRRWLARLAVAMLVVAVLAVLLRAADRGRDRTSTRRWAAAAVPVTAVLWMIVCRSSAARSRASGATGWSRSASSARASRAARRSRSRSWGRARRDRRLPRHRARARGGGRRCSACRCAPHLPAPSHETGAPLRDLLAGARAPVAALTLLFVLQEVHVIVVKHEAGGDAAGSYAVAAVAAKAIIWVAVGLGHVPAAGGGTARRERRWTRARCCSARSR